MNSGTTFISKDGLQRFYARIYEIFANKNHTHTGAQIDTATVSTRGTVQPDGTTIDITAAGIISAKTATGSAKGIVQPDGTSININNGTISVPDASTSQKGLLSSNDKTKLNGIATGATKAEVTDTTTLTITDSTGNTSTFLSGMTTAERNKLSGIADNANNYSLPTASSNTLGGIKVGNNLSITDGVLTTADTVALVSALSNYVTTTTFNTFKESRETNFGKELGKGLAVDNDKLHIDDLIAESTGQVSGPLAEVTAKGWSEQDGTPTPSDPIEIKIARGRNLLNTVTVTSGKYLASDGTEMDDASYSISDYIAVDADATYVTSGMGAVLSTYYAWYNANKTYISATQQTANGFTLTAPSNAAYVRVSLLNTNLEISQFELGSVATSYVPYGCVGLDVTINNTTATTPIPLPAKGWAGALTDTADELRIDSAGGYEWINRTSKTTTAATDGITGTVGTDILSSTGQIVDGVTVLYKLTTPTMESGYINLPNIPSDAIVTIPELNNLNVKYYIDGGSIKHTVDAYYARTLSEISELPAGDPTNFAPVEQAIATSNHTVGTLLTYEGKLYRVTTAIISGDSILDKITATSVAELNENVVRDASYVHTDSNFTAAEKAKLAELTTDGGGSGNYTLPTMSENTKGGAKLGSGLSVLNDTLSVDLTSENVDVAELTSSGEVTATEEVENDGVTSTVEHNLTEKLDSADYHKAMTWGEIGDKYNWGVLGTTSQTTGTTYTDTLGLEKPGNNSTVDIAKINNNYDTIDDAIEDTQESIAMIESHTAQSNHAAGSYFMLDNVLHQASSAIASGETITSGTNATPVTLEQTLTALNSNISTLLATTGIASTPSGKTLQGQISTLQDSVSSRIIFREYGSGRITISAGTVGTRGAQTSANVVVSGYTAVGCSLTYVTSSASYVPVAFLSGKVVYFNFYRATTGAYTGTENDEIKATVIYVKSN